MNSELTEEDIWTDEEPEDELVEAEGEPEIRFRMVTNKKQEPIRIDKFLMVRLVGATRNKVQQALDAGHILVNKEKVKSNYRVRPNDEIVVYDTRRVESTEVIPEPLPLHIVHEDDEVLVINKPAGMVVHPACGNYTGTLINGVAWHLQQQQGNTEVLPRVGLAHRIDKDTTGLIVIAKTEKSMIDLSAQFKAHTVHRRYVALVWGDFEEDHGTINCPVGRNLRFRKIMAAFPEGDHGKEAITHYKVLERFNYTTLLELQLETGRTHQIRVHMMHIGHPLFADTTYGGDRIVKGTVFSKYKQFIDNCFSIINRQSLHARELGFIHPGTGAFIKFESELPDDMQQVIGKWRTYSGAMMAKRR